MEYVDVVFCFDEKAAKNFCVAVSSMLMAQSSQEYEYRIHCITISEGQKKVNVYVPNLGQRYKFQIKFYIIDKTLFVGAFEIRNITVATYFRFLIPELLKETEKVIYIDTDTIIKRELGDLFKYDMKDLFFRGVKGRINLSAVWENESKRIYWNRLKKSYGKYINAGVLLMNLELIREYQIVKEWKLLMDNEFCYQDQDIINMTCSEKIGFIPPKYNCMAQWDDKVLQQFEREKIFTNEEIKEAIDTPVIIHFAGKKPWNSFLGGNLFTAAEWWKYVVDDGILFDLFKEDMLNCIENDQKEKKNIIWKSNRNNANYLFMNNWLQMKQRGYNLGNVLRKKKYNNIAIYGTSYIGERLFDELKGTDIVVKYGIDKKKKGEWRGIKVFSPDENLPDVDVIVVTAIYSYNEIVNGLVGKVRSVIISLEDLLREE
jgi:Lipopolysaccharide biosynthesis proteins, LPS:glycosyltransferases